MKKKSGGGEEKWALGSNLYLGLHFLHPPTPKSAVLEEEGSQCRQRRGALSARAIGPQAELQSKRQKAAL